MPHISRRENRSKIAFFKRTIAAQIHLATAIVALVGLVFLSQASYRAGTLHFWGTTVFGLTSVLVFTVSGVYHVLHDGYQITPTLAERLETLDQCSIYLFIAGTYTPFLINAVAPPWRDILRVTVWTMALLGLFYTAFRPKLPLWAQSRAVYTGMFVMMGWVLLVRAAEIYHALPPTALALFVAGNLSYSIGAIVYGTRRPRLLEGVFGFHELWHVFVTMGFAFHYAMVGYFYF